MPQLSVTERRQLPTWNGDSTLIFFSLQTLLPDLSPPSPLAAPASCLTGHAQTSALTSWSS